MNDLTHVSSDSAAQGKVRELSSVLQDAMEITPGTAMTLLPDLIEAIRLHLGMEVGFLSEFRDGHRVFRYVSHDGEREIIRPGDSGPLEESYCLLVVQEQIPNLIKDAQKLDAVQHLEATSALNVGAHVSIPVHLQDGELYGTLCCFSTRPDDTLTQRDLDFMYVVGDLIGTMLEHECAHLRQIEQKREYLDQVVHSGAMRSVWQPIVDMESGQIVSVEALTRFNTRPYRPPNEWFDEAAQVDRHLDLERNALIKGMEILSMLPESIRVGCNLSGAAALDEGVRNFLADQDLNRIVLEITEHDIIDEYEELTEVLEPLRSRGMRLAIDDFGAGYASFRHILRLRPDSIKIDMSLIRGIDSNKTAQSVVRALCAFAGENEQTLVAEGIETKGEFEMLRSMGVTQGQGYLMHKPLQRAALLELM